MNDDELKLSGRMMSNFETHTYSPDLMRDTLHVSAPFRLIGGRGIVDAKGRVVAYGVAGETLAGNGCVRKWAASRDDLSAACADDNIHAIANILNDPARYFENYCATRALASTDPKTREWWQRMAGNARKAATM